MKESAQVLIMFNQPMVYECFVHHPLVILLKSLEAFSYMMTCEITISVGAPGALFVLLGAMVSKLFVNWKI